LVSFGFLWFPLISFGLGLGGLYGFPLFCFGFLRFALVSFVLLFGFQGRNKGVTREKTKPKEKTNQ